MSPILEKPILHGRDHCPGGADPIPCLPPHSAVGTFESTVMATSDLLAYWRLGEAGEPWADTSGYGPTVPAEAADLVLEAAGTALTPDVTGALAADDDGALEFNYDGTGGASSASYLNWDTPADTRFDFGSGSTNPMSVAAWIKVKASVLTRRGVIVGTTSEVSGTPNRQAGWGLQVVYPERSIRFTRGQVTGSNPETYATTAGGVDVDQWYLAVGTYDGTDVRLYMDSVLVDEAASPHVWPNLNIGVKIGHGRIVGQWAWHFGSVDEAAVWTRALSQAEINTLYEAGVGGMGAGSQVLISDGEGGATWGQVTPQAVEPGSDGQVLSTVDGAVAWADPAAGAGGASASDTLAWMPLTTVVGSVPELVWDADDNLIPTLVTL